MMRTRNNVDFSQAKLSLADKLKAFFIHDIFLLPNTDKFIRLEVPLNSLNLLSWLQQQKNNIKTYWSDREQKFEMAGVGEADVIHGQQTIDLASCFNHFHKFLSPDCKNLRYYGGINFNGKPILASCWQGFGNYRFIVPRFELYRDNQNTSLVCNFKLQHSDSYNRQLEYLLNELDELVFDSFYKSKELPEFIKREDIPNERDWDQNINMALASFERGETAKIVLARQAIFEFLGQVEPLTVLEILKKSNTRLFRFCFQPSEGNAFIGGSPERLYFRLEKLLQTEAIAGTRSRGKSLREDQKFGEELLNSDKDLREHKFVVHSLQGALAQMCHSVGLNREPMLLKLNKIQHLYTPCNGILFDEVSDAEILSKLHPTPAVGGYPKVQALEVIEQIETFERGWYASPVGWVGHDSSEFVVGIRSGLINNNKLSLFSGAGIVQGSDPQEEWQEIENKIGTFLQIMKYFDKIKTPIQIG
ncbi:isochorismate synthase [Aphanothece sacrum]|uniref:Isochorismate synthase MenF n=1 Tax=Aphanothece sacrum FPU1 TaxID=1920663 RepID=A0A401IBP1_APHSA|nr:isochorismate synthase [Aphanothece sacrum]GBF78646.1 isochorismate synthase [Aphanothece sacrum FPU1]GBF84935.1 isochorismate synthase [Aphanothece sacrum FPU3]